MIVLICGFSLNGLHMFARKMSVMKESTKFTWWNSIGACEKQNKQKKNPAHRVKMARLMQKEAQMEVMGFQKRN